MYDRWSSIVVVLSCHSRWAYYLSPLPELLDVSWWGGRMMLCGQGLRWNVWMPAYHFHCRIGRTPRPVYALARRRHRLSSPLEGCQVIQLREFLCWGTRMGNQFQWLRTWRVIVIWGDFEGGVVSLALRVAIFNAVHNRRQDSLRASFHFNSALSCDPPLCRGLEYTFHSCQVIGYPCFGIS